MNSSLFETDPNTQIILIIIYHLFQTEKTQKWSGELKDINFVNNINAV